MFGERNMIRDGYRWDVIACFKGNSSGVRIAVRKTKRGAQRLANEFHRTLRPHVEQAYVRLRYDPLLDDNMNKKKRRMSW